MLKKALGLAALGVGAGAYALAEPFRFRLQSHNLWLGKPGPSLSILHLSDLHMTGSTRSLRRWLGRLPQELKMVPDLVIATGDLINDDGGIEPAVEVMGGFEARHGLFYVLGSHDYYQSRFQSYSKYFTGRRSPGRLIEAATGELEKGLKEEGWAPLTNATEVLDTPKGRIRLAGMDDPYLERHEMGHLHRASSDDLAVAVMHAPNIVSEAALAGFDLVLSGHTHGGQVRLPGIGAIVTNCTLPAALAGGPNRVGGTWLHASPGLGMSPYAPIRFGCRPEATLLWLRGGSPH